MKCTTKTTIKNKALRLGLTASLCLGSAGVMNATGIADINHITSDATSINAPISQNVAYAAPSDDKQAEANAALEQLNSMQRTLEEAENTYYIAQQDHETATEKVSEAQGKIEIGRAHV